MEQPVLKYDITKDDLTQFQGKGPVFVTFGEVMVRDTPADDERPERTRTVHLSMAGSEYTLAHGAVALWHPCRLHHARPGQPVWFHAAQHRA